MNRVIYTYINNDQLKYIDENFDLKIHIFENNYDYAYHDFIDISLAIQHLQFNPQNKILLQSIEPYLKNTKIIIHENLVNTAMNMFPTLFYEKIRLSEVIEEIVAFNNSPIINKKILYFYRKNEITPLITFFNEKEIPFIDLSSMYIKESIENILINNKIIVDITKFIENRNIVPFDYFIKTFENREITYICKYEIYNNDLIHYFKEEKHISELYPQFIPKEEDEKHHTIKITDLNYEEFNLMKQEINENLIGHENFKTLLFEKLKKFRVLNKLELKKIFSIFILGDSGLGKTETGRLINNFLDKNVPLIKINFGNYSSKDSLNSLIGSPRGFIGSEDGELSIKLSNPHTGIILCDEFEKADSKIISFFLELLEEGKFTDSQSLEYNLEGYIIIFTSNLNRKDFLNKIPNEFKSRIDIITEFKPLNINEKNEFVELEIRKIEKLLRNNSEYNDININNSKLKINLDEPNLRNIKRDIQNQIIELIENSEKD